MTKPIYEYPDTVNITQRGYVLYLLLTRPQGLTQSECETLTKGLKYGNMRQYHARVWEIKNKWGWPVVAQPEGHGYGDHARDFMRWDRLSDDLGLAADLLKEVALNAISKGVVFGPATDLSREIEKYKAADLRKSYAILNSKPMVQCDFGFLAGPSA